VEGSCECGNEDSDSIKFDRISRIDEDLIFPQEEHCSMELVNPHNQVFFE
jgi:hypothetical protein